MTLRQNVNFSIRRTDCARLSADQGAGPSTLPTAASAREPERVRTEIGLLLLVANLIMGTIMAPLAAFARPNTASPIFTYDIDRAVSILLVILFFLGGVLVVSGRRPFAPGHAELAVLGFALWIGVTIFDLFLLPYWITSLAPSIAANVIFAVTGMVETAIVVAATALLTYNLQSSKGKILLWLGALVGLGLAVGFDSQNLHLFPYYPNIVQQTIVSLGALSTALFATAFIAALFRIRGQE